MNGIQAYSEISAFSEVMGTSSYRQIQLLIERVVSDVSNAMVALEKSDIPTKCKHISSANNIVVYLRDCLDPSKDPVLTDKLGQIYEHLERQLFIANAKNSIEALKECETIINNIKTWWDNVSPD